MANALADVFESITQNMRQDQQMLNALDDDGDGDAGDNMVANMDTIAQALRQVEGRDMTVDQMLQYAGQTLRQQGKGATAPLYANGLDQAARNLAGKQSFSLEDLAGLLSGLAQGIQNTPGVKQGEGGLLDGLIPGVTAFLESRKGGKSMIEALLAAFMASQRGAYQTSSADKGFGSAASKSTKGRVDPGAAGASSILGGLLDSLLGGGLQAGRGEQPSKPGLGDLLGGSGLDELFGGLLGGGTQQRQQQQQQRPRGQEPRAPLGPTEII